MGFTFLIIFCGVVSTSFARNLFELEASFDISETLTSSSGVPFVDTESEASSEYLLSPDVVSLLFNTQAAHEQYTFLEQGQEEVDQFEEEMFDKNLECIPLGIDLCVVGGLTSRLCILSDLFEVICSTKTIAFTDKCDRYKCTGQSSSSTIRDYDMDYNIYLPKQESEIIPTKLSSFKLS